MGEAGRRPTQGLVQQHVPGGAGDPLFGADDVGDAHQVVIHYVGHLIRGETVGLQQDVVVQLAILVGDAPAHLILEGRRSLQGDGEADHVRFAGGDAPIGILAA